MIEIGNIYGFDNELKTLLSIVRDANKVSLKILLSRIENDKDELIKNLLTPNNLKDIPVTLISYITEKKIFGDINVLDLLNLFEDEKEKFIFAKKCDSYMIENIGFGLLRKFVDFNSYDDYCDKLLEIANKNNLNFFFRNIKINYVLSNDFLSSEKGKLIMLERLKGEFTNPELNILSKMYDNTIEKDKLEYLKEILKERGYYDKFRKNLLKLSV